MGEIMLYVGGMVGVMSMVVFFSWVLDKLFENDDYRNRVTAEDLAEMTRLFEDDGAFVGWNEKGEKFVCGYKK